MASWHISSESIVAGIAGRLRAPAAGHPTPGGPARRVDRLVEAMSSSASGLRAGLDFGFLRAGLYVEAARRALATDLAVSTALGPFSVPMTKASVPRRTRRRPSESGAVIGS